MQRTNCGKTTKKEQTTVKTLLKSHSASPEHLVNNYIRVLRQCDQGQHERATYKKAEFDIKSLIKLMDDKKNYFTEFDNILSDRVRIVNEYATQYHHLKSEAERAISSVYYGRNAFHLGHFCPSLIKDKITGGFKRDKLRNSRPKTNKGYVSYEVDKNGKLVRMNEINSLGSVSETYIIKKENEDYSITFSNGKPDRIIDSVRTLYEDSKIIRCDFIGTGSLWSEIYDYAILGSNVIHCTQY